VVKEMNDIVGSRIREERELLGLTQGELAKMVNLSGKAAIANYEKGYSRPDIGMIAKLANIFNCTTDYLLVLTDHKKAEIKKALQPEDKLFDDLSEEDKKEAIRYMNYLKHTSAGDGEMSATLEEKEISRNRY